jgi:DNA-binding response OmpR family regulator
MPPLELLKRVGTKKAFKPQNAIILLVVGGRYEGLEQVLRKRGYTVVVPSTADQAVALCLHNRIAVTLIDRDSLALDGDWSLAHSLKMVAPHTPVLLLLKGRVSKREGIPAGVDWMVSDKDPSQVLGAVKRFVRLSMERMQAQSAPEDKQVPRG